jgi:hypothetical protein
MREWRYSSHEFLTSGLNGGVGSVYSTAVPGTQWIESCIGPRAGLDAEEKSLCPYPKLNFNSSAFQPAAK